MGGQGLANPPESHRIIHMTTKEHIGEWVAIDQLKKWDKNPRDNSQAIDRVADSIKRFGFAAPIIARKEDQTIIAGHTRFAAAQKLGLDKVPVRFMDLDPADAKLLALADNKLGELAEWDQPLLKTIFETESFELDDLNIAGFDFAGIDSIFQKEENEEYQAKESIEINTDDFENFDHKCPRCGFEYDQ